MCSTTLPASSPAATPRAEPVPVPGVHPGTPRLRRQREGSLRPAPRELAFTPCEQPFVGRCRTWLKLREFAAVLLWHVDCNEAEHESRAVSGRSPDHPRSD